MCAKQEYPPMHFHKMRALIQQEDQVGWMGGWVGGRI